MAIGMAYYKPNMPHQKWMGSEFHKLTFVCAHLDFQVGTYKKWDLEAVELSPK